MGQSGSKEMSASQVKKDYERTWGSIEFTRKRLCSEIDSFLSRSGLPPEAYSVPGPYGISCFVPWIVTLARAREQQIVDEFENIMRLFIAKLGLRLQRGSEGETSLIRAGWMAGAHAPMYEYAKELQRLEPEGYRLIALHGDVWRLENQRLAESRVMKERERLMRERPREVEEIQRLRNTGPRLWYA